jgi:hypothetical protein
MSTRPPGRPTTEQIKAVLLDHFVAGLLKLGTEMCANGVWPVLLHKSTELIIPFPECDTLLDDGTPSWKHETLREFFVEVLDRE